MKKPVLITTITLLILIFGCSTSEPGIAKFQVKSENEHPEGAVSDDKTYYRSLADYLYQVPGLNISHPKNTQMFTIRGISSFNS